MRRLLLASCGALLVIAVAVYINPPGRLMVGSVNIQPWLLPGVMAIALVEALALSLMRDDYDWKAWFASSSVALWRQFVNFIPLSVIGPVFAFAWSHRLTTIQLGPWWSFAVLLLGQEFCYYWLHRASHRVRWFWATHAVHHSPNDFTLAAAYRLGWTSKISGEAIFNAPLIWLGFRPEIVGATVLFNLLYQFWLHTELVPKLGPLEWILNTPSHHRVHHASNGVYLDRNYGGVLIIFDRLFGTFVEENAEVPCRYGLVKPLKSYNPLYIALHEWIAMAKDVWTARSWRERIGYVAGPPGWSPGEPQATAEPVSPPLPELVSS